MNTKIVDPRISLVKQFAVSFPLFKLNSDDTGSNSRGNYRSPLITNVNLPSSSLVSGMNYQAELYGVERCPSNETRTLSSLTETLVRHGRVGGSAIGGAFLLKNHLQELPLGYIFCFDAPAHMYVDERNYIRVPRLCIRSGSWDFSLDFWHRNDVTAPHILCCFLPLP